jgi:branched-subunit amino acid transport protein
MTALLIVLTASLATWLLRIGFITMLPAERLPARVQRAFDDVAPAVLAAIVVSHVVRAGGPNEISWPTLAAVAAAAAVAWRSKNLALPVVVGVAVFGLLFVAPDLAATAPTQAEEPERAAVAPRRADTVLPGIGRPTPAVTRHVAEGPAAPADGS